MNKIYCDKVREILINRRNNALDMNADAHNTLMSYADYASEYSRRCKLVASLPTNMDDIDNIIKAIDECDTNLETIARAYSLTLNNFYCKACDDTGILPSGGKCQCFMSLYNDILRKLSLSSDLKPFAFADSKLPACAQSDKLTKLYSRLSDYCEAFPRNSKKMLILAGSVGVGKSYMLSAMANSLIAKGVIVQYFSAFHLNQMLLAHHTNQLKDGGAFLESILSCEALFIDDLGTEPIYTNVTAEYLYNILESRDKLHTFISTNLELSSNIISTRYGERVFSRLYDKSKCALIKIVGDDLRFK